MKTLSKIIIFFFLFLGVLGVSTAYGNQPSYNPSPTAPLENDKSEDAQPENDEEMAECQTAMENCPVEAIGND